MLVFCKMIALSVFERVGMCEDVREGVAWRVKFLPGKLRRCQACNRSPTAAERCRYFAADVSGRETLDQTNERRHASTEDFKIDFGLRLVGDSGKVPRRDCGVKSLG